jgi:soluble lytic murein transglycosylase
MASHKSSPRPSLRFRWLALCVAFLSALSAGALPQATQLALAPEALPLRAVVDLQHLFGASQNESEGRQSLEDLLSQALDRRREGAYEDAARLYREALAGGPADADGVAEAAAEAHLASGDYAAAYEMAARALETNSSRSAARFVQAQALASLGHTGQAVDLIEQHLANGELGGYPLFRAGELRAQVGDHTGARAAYESAIQQGMSTLWTAVAARRIGRSHLTASGDPWASTPWLERAASIAAEVDIPVWFDGALVEMGREARRAAVLVDLGSARAQTGESAAAVDAYAEAAVAYPSSAEAATALARLAEMGQLYRLDGYQRGRVYLSAGRPRDAIDAFESFLAADPPAGDAASARYYQAQGQRSAGDPNRAVASYLEMADWYPSNQLAPEALWQRGRIFESSRTAAETVRAYLVVADRYPSSPQAARGLLRAGWLQLYGGDAAAARETWRRLATQHPDPGARAQGLFWLGRGALGRGDVEAASEVLTEASTLDPVGYEGLRARDLAAFGLGAEPYANRSASGLGAGGVDDVAACATWIDSWSGTEQAGLAEQRLARIGALLSAGLRHEGLAEALEGAAVFSAQPRGLYALSRGSRSLGLYPASMYLATRIGAASPARSAERGPQCLQRLVYPDGFSALVQSSAQQYGIDPYLLLALLRQESWFSDHARSSADARGLSQVIPATAREVARAQGRADFAVDDLFRPREAIAMGAWYLANQIADMGQRPLLALAAYNGGPGNARRWAGGNLSVDPDDFVEAIDFAETRSYVRSIYEQYARYRELYPA